MHHANGTSHLRLCALAMLVVALIAFTAATAFAGPAKPTMTTEQLQQLIDANGGEVDGYFRTVMKGSDIIDIPVHITAVTSGFASGPPELSALIMFEAYGPYIDAPDGVGGIAAGMSGSPLFVDDGPVPNDTLVGAVSYGDWFTLNGMGLATPIAAMTAIENDYPMDMTGIRTLPKPVVIEGKAINSVIVAPDPEKLDSDLVDSAFVARPLAAQYLGGLNPKNRVYQAYKKHLESHGGELVAYGLSSMQHPYDATFEPGSAIAALAARGDLWAGGIGTVTYTSGDNVLAFGHPAFHSGESGLFMTNAWIDGVWGSTNTPYKLGRPAALRGTITQDRGAGIMGVEGLKSSVATVTATVFNVSDSKVGTSTVEIPSFAIDSASWDFEGLAPVSAYIAATHACDSYLFKGSALTTTTVVVSDGAQEFEIVRSNMFDDSMDVPAAAMMDVASIVSQLQQLGDNGLAHPRILSVDVVATVTKARRTAEIVDVNVAGGLRTGDNTATVSLLRYGVEATQTVDVGFKIPTGVPLTGELQATGPWGMESDPEEMFLEEMLFEEMSGPSSDRRTVAQAVADIEAELPNNTLMVTYAPADIPSELDEEPAAPKTYKPIEATTEVDYVVTGSAGKVAPKFRLDAFDTTVIYNDMTAVIGELLGAENVSKFDVQRLYAGSSTPSSLTGGSYDPDEGPFMWVTPPMPKNTKFTFIFAGDDDTLPTAGSITIKVKARTTLSASRTTFKKGKATTLTASVTPTTATGKIVFERYRGGWWSSIGTRTLSGGKASMSYKPSSTGTYKIRARYVPVSGATNVSSTSSTRTLKVTP